MTIMQINEAYQLHYKEFVYFAKSMKSANPTDLVNDVYIHLYNLEPNRLANYLNKYSPKDFIINTIKIFYYRERGNIKKQKDLFIELDTLDDIEQSIINCYDKQVLVSLISELPKDKKVIIKSISNRKPLSGVLNTTVKKARNIRYKLISEIKEDYFKKTNQ